MNPLKINDKMPYINTFDSNLVENSFFFFIDLLDAVRYIKYPNSKFGVYHKSLPEYKILELEVPNELVLKYLGIGSYYFENEYVNYLAVEVAIPFEKIKNTEGCHLYNQKTIQLNNIKIYDEDSLQTIQEYVNRNPNYKSSSYLQSIEQILNILGFECFIGTLYKKQISGKLRFLMNNSAYIELLLKQPLSIIQQEIEENIDKLSDNIRGKYQ